MSADPERSETEIPENLIAIQHTRQVRKLTGVRRRAAASRCADAIAVALQR